MVMENCHFFNLILVLWLFYFNTPITTGKFTMGTMLEQMFKLITLGSFPFKDWLRASLGMKLVKISDLPKYRILIMIELEGTLISIGGESLTSNLRQKVMGELSAKIHYNMNLDLDTLYTKFLEQIETDFNLKMNHKFDLDNGYRFKVVALKITFEKIDTL